MLFCLVADAYLLESKGQNTEYLMNSKQTTGREISTHEYHQTIVSEKARSEMAVELEKVERCENKQLCLKHGRGASNFNCTATLPLPFPRTRMNAWGKHKVKA